MPRQRDFQKEYADRVKREQARGFTGYPQARKAREQIKAELKSLQERGILDKIPKPRSEAHNAMLQARAIILGYSRDVINRHAREKTSVLARTKKGRAVREKLRRLLGFYDGNYSLYYPFMRSLY